MTNETLRHKIVTAMRHRDKSYLIVGTYEEYADAILALPETSGWTALEAATEALANAEALIDELEAKLAKAESGLDKIANASMGETSCYYTNRSNIMIARAALAELEGTDQ